MIARAEQDFSPPVPDGKRKITAQVLHASFAPRGIGVQDQLGIRRCLPNLAPGVGEFRFEFGAAVDPRVGGNPELAIETGRLVFGQRFIRGSEQRVAESDRTIGPHLARIRTAIGKKVRERLQQWAIHWSTVAPENSHDAAQ